MFGEGDVAVSFPLLPIFVLIQTMNVILVQGSIADMLRATAEEVLVSRVPPGFVFIEEYGQYYSRESGYYYDQVFDAPKLFLICVFSKQMIVSQNTALFYHPTTQTYYFFDDDSGEYRVHACLKKRTGQTQPTAGHLRSPPLSDVLTAW